MRSKYWVMAAASILPLAFIGCSEESKAIPDHLEVASDAPRFSVDTSQNVHVFAVKGHGGMKLEASLVGTDGKRALEVVHTESKKRLMVAEADWNLPPASAMNKAGDHLTCHNLLTGSPSEITGGPLPDPRNGMILLCKLIRHGESHAREIKLATGHPAPWLRDVTARRDSSFNVTFFSDDGLLHGQNAEVEKEFSQIVHVTGQVSEAALVRSTCSPKINPEG